jgi:sugar-specific transcriptional regulator TrmB
MIRSEKDVENLVAIGLTKTQAKVYLTLAILGKANARTIWKNSGVARQDIYRILTELEEKSLVEKIVAAPTEFRAIPLLGGLSVLLKRRVDEYNETEKKARELLDRFRANHQENMTAKEFEFTMVTTRDAVIRKGREGALNIKKSVDIIDSWDSFKHASVAGAEPIIKAAKRNVKFRFITDKPKDGETEPKIFQTWKKNGWAELRHVPTQPPATIRIEDRKQVTLSIVTTTYRAEAPSLFSDNPCLVAILQDYFEILWERTALSL